MAEMKHFDYIRFAVCDFHGRSRGRVVPARHVEEVLQSGTSIYGGSAMFSLQNEVVSLKDGPYADIMPRASLLPDVSTLFPVPWCGGSKFKVAEIICESYWLKDKIAQHACPRYVAGQQIQKLACLGMEIFSGYEMEFMFRKSNQSFPPANYMNLTELTKHDTFFLEMESLLFDAGIDIQALNIEADAGCFEAALTPLKGICAPDSSFKFKNAILEIADKHNYCISFLSNYENADNALHFNHSLWDKLHQNKFGYQDDSSETLYHWMAGILKHARALTAFFSPTNNCYRRLNKVNRPAKIFWGYDERSACIKLRQNSDKGLYLENRMPGSASNPYLVLAATVAAGIDGIVNKLECPPPGKEAATDELPRSLGEAVQDLQADKVIVESLGQEFVQWYVATLEHDMRNVPCTEISMQK